MNLNKVSFHLPTHIFWKDLSFRYVGCNQSMLHSTGLKDVTNILYKYDYDLCWADSHGDLFREGDQETLSSQNEFQKYESILCANGITFKLLTTKKVWYDDHGNKIGLVGSSVLLDKHEKMPENLPLSEMQKKCLLGMIVGMSAKQIAKELIISPRTVESYIQIAKYKLKCDTKYQLIKKALSYYSIMNALTMYSKSS